jgi:Dehydrogenases with different specificities (related to short-chain alcohol dehydrogenases)
MPAWYWRAAISSACRNLRDGLSGSLHQIEAFDLTATDQIQQWIRGITAEEPLDAIVHVAGKQLTSPIRMLTPAMLDDVLRTNLHSAMMLARAFCGKASHNKAGGSLVFVSSVMGSVSKPGISGYSASKAALSGVAKSLALELAADRIRVNCVAPAFVETEMLAALRDALPEDQFQIIEKAHPLGFGKPEDVANAIAFLVADTGRWITGTTLIVDGGYSAQ